MSDLGKALGTDFAPKFVLHSSISQYDFEVMAKNTFYDAVGGRNSSGEERAYAIGTAKQLRWMLQMQRQGLKKMKSRSWRY